jgi:hypothetical protein
MRRLQTLALAALLGCALTACSNSSTEPSTGESQGASAGTSAGTAQLDVRGTTETFKLTDCSSTGSDSLQADGESTNYTLAIAVDGGTGSVKVTDTSGAVVVDATAKTMDVGAAGDFTMTAEQNGSQENTFAVSGSCLLASPSPSA